MKTFRTLELASEFYQQVEGVKLTGHLVQTEKCGVKSGWAQTVAYQLISNFKHL